MEKTKDLSFLIEEGHQCLPTDVEYLQRHDLLQKSAVGLGVITVGRNMETEVLLDGFEDGNRLATAGGEGSEGCGSGIHEGGILPDNRL